MEKSYYLIDVLDVDGDGSEFEFRCFKDGELVEESKSRYCFEDLMLDYNDFSNMIFEKYKIDCRFDSVEIKLDYKY